MTRSIQFFFARSPRSWSRPEHMSGVSVSETMPLAKIETMMVIENSRKMRPTRPPIKTSGKNTAARETVMARMVKLISLADCREASRAPRPLSMRRTVFRSEERRVGKECPQLCRSRGSPYHQKKNSRNLQIKALVKLLRHPDPRVIDV